MLSGHLSYNYLTPGTNILILVPAYADLCFIIRLAFRIQTLYIWKRYSGLNSILLKKKDKNVENLGSE